MALEYSCIHCGGLAVTREAWVEWDAARQDWVLATIFEQAFCLSCYRPTSLEGKPAGYASSVR